MKYQKAIKAAVAVIVLFLLISIIYTAITMAEHVILTPESIITLNDNWTISCKGQVYECDDISNANVGIVNDQEVISISRILDDYGFDNPCLSLFSIHAIVNVYLDDNLIYSFGQNYYDSQNIVPKAGHYVNLGSSYAGKLLRIELIGCGDNSFSGLSNIFVGQRKDILVQDFHIAAVAIIVGIFLMTLGIILLILSPYLFFYHNRDLRILFSGMISLILGIYIMAFYRVFELLIHKPLLNTTLEYISLYTIPTSIIGYLTCIYSGKIRRIFASLFTLDIGLFIAAVIAHFTHIAKFNDFTAILHIVSGVEFLLIMPIIVKDFLDRKKTKSRKPFTSDNIFVLGLILFMGFSIIDVVRYNMYKYGSASGETDASLVGFTLGALLFVVCLLISYLYYNIFSTNIASKQSKILDLAYTDPLTGLSNRARCEQMMQMISEEHGQYAIISLDLNKLKYINDTLGHHEGDRLLTGFATILSDCFWDANLVGRMGGDEFIVIMLEDRTLNVTKRIHELYAMINDWNHKEQVFKYSASYGYAYSYEVPNGLASEVYMLADNRMYEMKREHHEHPDQEVISNA